MYGCCPRFLWFAATAYSTSAGCYGFSFVIHAPLFPLDAVVWFLWEHG
jgi:hypothetical protein